MSDLPEWPKTVSVYAHSGKEYMREIGEDLGLTGESLASFRHALSDIDVVLSVNQDGSYHIVSFKE